MVGGVDGMTSTVCMDCIHKTGIIDMISQKSHIVAIER